MSTGVGCRVGDSVVGIVGDVGVGAGFGLIVGARAGCRVGLGVGVGTGGRTLGGVGAGTDPNTGAGVGRRVRTCVGLRVGARVGRTVGLGLGEGVGAAHVSHGRVPLPVPSSKKQSGPHASGVVHISELVAVRVMELQAPGPTQTVSSVTTKSGLPPPAP